MTKYNIYDIIFNFSNNSCVGQNINMAETKDKNVNKIKEARFIIFMPFLITAICAWFDFLFNKESLDNLDILKMIYTYFFPSIAALMITLIIQKAVYDEESCSIADNKVLLSSLLLIVYGVIYISCLFEWGLLTSVLFGAFSIIYMIITWFFCLDKKITHNIVDEERASVNRYKNVMERS